ncbi:TetR/AcrR family transcriptional regulator [Pseudomonas lactucae]|uniref:TetR/AcrR family transcriptional regulator n=1 Tax=Pseudomonas lactucae TaxID=2813360 RepID=UPI003CC5B695
MPASGVPLPDCALSTAVWLFYDGRLIKPGCGIMSTRSDLLSSAEILLRTKGYAAFSYADLAAEIGIKKASIHHHFQPRKALRLLSSRATCSGSRNSWSRSMTRTRMSSRA